MIRANSENYKILEVTLGYKIRVCHTCNGDLWVTVKPLIYVDIFGNEYSSIEYASTQQQGMKVLPLCQLWNKKEYCPQCKGSGMEYYVKLKNNI